MVGVPEKDLQTHLGNIERQRAPNKKNILDINNVDPELIKKQIELFKKTKNSSSSEKSTVASSSIPAAQSDVSTEPAAINLPPATAVSQEVNHAVIPIPVVIHPQYPQLCYRPQVPSQAPLGSQSILGSVPHTPNLIQTDLEAPPPPWMMAPPMGSPNLSLFNNSPPGSR